MSLMDMLKSDNFKTIFTSSLCPGEIGFSEDGSLSPCFCATYMFTPAILLVTLWALLNVHNLNTNDHEANTIGGRVKFLMTCLYTFVICTNGASVFNPISLVASFATLVVIFILSFLDMKGVKVPQKPIEAYFFVVAVYSGFTFCNHISVRNCSLSNSSLNICLLALVIGSTRNIMSAFDAAVEESNPKIE